MVEAQSRLGQGSDRGAGALAAMVTAAMEAGMIREAAAAVTGTQSWCAQLRQWQSAAEEAGSFRALLGGERM